MPHKQNQDSFVLSPNMMQSTYQHFFAVCDGHGQFGKEVSNQVKQRLPYLVNKEI
jgi:serine/threonine protein phosphatase PrpC